MILSVSYNFFNGDEHLIPSLKAIRTVVEHISVVWQEVSNAGETIHPLAKQALKDATELGLVDTVERYEPDLTLPRGENERAKRQLGLELARRRNATHFLSMDADEFYRPAEMQHARGLIQKNGWQSTSVASYLHIRQPTWRVLDTTCCCFITEIRPTTEIGVEVFPCPNVDPTRRMTSDGASHHHFEPEVVAMYHMNLVRRDLAQKLRNSTTTNLEFLNTVAAAVQSWEPGNDFIFPMKGKLHPVFVANEFDTFDAVSVEWHS